MFRRLSDTTFERSLDWYETAAECSQVPDMQEDSDRAWRKSLLWGRLSAVFRFFAFELGIYPGIRGDKTQVINLQAFGKSFQLAYNRQGDMYEVSMFKKSCERVVLYERVER